MSFHVCPPEKKKEKKKKYYFILKIKSHNFKRAEKYEDFK